jgi:hypothetical protein
MKTYSKKYKVQDTNLYPHIGQFLLHYFDKNNINRAHLSRQLDIAESTATRYLYQESIQFGILWKMSVALKHNLLADLASLLPIEYCTPKEKEQQLELEALRQELNDLKIENKTYKSLLSNK